MESTIGISSELGKLWGHRLELDFEESCLSDVIDQPELQVVSSDEEKELTEAAEYEQQSWKESAERRCGAVSVDGRELGDFPARYTVTDLKRNEFLAIGLYVDPRIVPGFKYRVRPLNSEASDKEEWFWSGLGLELESIGRGYSRRLTFAPPAGCRNSNPHYFWADSREFGFALSPQLVSPGDQFTVFDSSNLPVASLNILQLQDGQVETGQRILADGSIEKTGTFRGLAEVEWYCQDLALPNNTIPVSGRAVSVRSRGGGVVTTVSSASLGGGSPAYTLRPGTSLLTSHLHGANIGDVPATYTIVGLEPHQLPVIGTYIDPRIAVGFHYRVARVGGGGVNRWVWKEPVRLDSIGRGYGKRLIFSRPSTRTRPGFSGSSSEELYLWSDSNPDGLGFEHAAVRAGAAFSIHAGGLHLGRATVFRADAPQTERTQTITKEGLIKEVHVEVTCTVELETTETTRSATDIMRISGTAVLLKKPTEPSASLLRLQDIGLESQLNLLFLTRAEELLFLPISP